MLLLIAGLILFLGVHSVAIVDVAWRDRMVARFGELPWKAVYGVIALIGLVLIVNGYADARRAVDPILIYQAPLWLRHVTLLLMLPVFVLLLAAYLPGRIQTVTKHPMLLAVKVWALAHLLANGTLADLLLFGSFLAWAVTDRISLKRRAPTPVPGAPAGRFNDAIALGGGVLLYLLFLFWWHEALFGVAPLG
ncbi:NnrU family protein [Halochromatium glycolicum]|uniref:NnrU family protein n=1 Tax=Halochromatium glycolicum TaxID=85075 RepID=A0AAJ0XA07_9GAMM|nr:NnrU family protein [Halochromatium glycolicum]MBK1705306.1 NnrU family protein [Halochromatium glycolicum]